MTQSRVGVSLVSSLMLVVGVIRPLEFSALPESNLARLMPPPRRFLVTPLPRSLEEGVPSTTLISGASSISGDKGPLLDELFVCGVSGHGRSAGGIGRL